MELENVKLEFEVEKDRQIEIVKFEPEKV